MDPSSIRYWVRTGKICPPPWSPSELHAVKHRRDAPARARGVGAGHGTLARYIAGCGCERCRQASAAAQKERERSEAERRFPPDARDRLVELVGRSVLFRDALAGLGLNAQQVWGRASVDQAWGAVLQRVIDEHRPDGMRHGVQSGYRAGCRCSDCRATVNRR